MRSIISLLALTALAHAAPRPQQIEYEIIGSSPLPKRDGCTPQPTTPNIYNVDLSSANAFRNDGSICNVSMAAQTPSGYLQTFMELYAATSTNAYMGYMSVDTYSPSQCSAQCDSIDGCTSFNIFFERDPTLDPSTNCTNPNATANIKCSFWGIPIDATSATNKGQFRSSFEVAIAGSNGYVKNGYVELNPGTAPNYVGPSYLANAAINAPRDCNNQNSFLGSRTFNTGAFDPHLCSAACDDTTAYNARHPPAYGAPLKCVFFNTYMLFKNGAPYQQQCAMYTQAWNNTYATNTGYKSGSDVYTIEYSSTYYNPSYPCHPICAIASPSLSSATAAVATSTVSSTLSTSTVTPSTTVAPYSTVASSSITVAQNSTTPFAP